MNYAKNISNPTQQSLGKLKRLVRFLKRERQWSQIFSYGRMVEEVTMFADSDWAGCQEIRKSSSASVILLGHHALKRYTRKQKVIARSNAEAELYAAALGASESKGFASLLRDLGLRDEANAGQWCKGHRTRSPPASRVKRTLQTWRPNRSAMQ